MYIKGQKAQHTALIDRICLQDSTDGCTVIVTSLRPTHCIYIYIYIYIYKDVRKALDTATPKGMELTNQAELGQHLIRSLPNKVWEFSMC